MFTDFENISMLVKIPGAYRKYIYIYISAICGAPCLQHLRPHRGGIWTCWVMIAMASCLLPSCLHMLTTDTSPSMSAGVGDGGNLDPMNDDQDDDDSDGEWDAEQGMDDDDGDSDDTGDEEDGDNEGFVDEEVIKVLENDAKLFFFTSVESTANKRVHTRYP